MSRNWGRVDGVGVKAPAFVDKREMGKNQRMIGMKLWDEMIPDGAFVDDPRADAYDRNGEVRRAGSFIPVIREYNSTTGW